MKLVKPLVLVCMMMICFITDVTAKDLERIFFDGKALIVVSDGDQGGLAYATGDLDRIDCVEDSLSLLTFSEDSAIPGIAPVKVSNSVVSWPQVVAVSPDGLRAYVVEIRAEPADGVNQVCNVFEDLPEGRNVTLVDIENKENPEMIRTVDVGANPESVSISPDGQWLAVNTVDVGEEIKVFGISSDTLEEVVSRQENGNSDREITIASVQWHPSGKYLAHVMSDSVTFYSFSYHPDSGAASLDQYGNRVNVGTSLSAGKFTPDGRFFIVPDVNWKDMFLGTLFNKNGSLISIAFSDKIKTTDSVGHYVISSAEVGRSPEGFAMSPDGSLCVTVNMERSYLPDYLTLFTPKLRTPTLSLVTLNTESGELTTMSENYTFSSLLPESAVFDSDGDMLAVTVYHEKEPHPVAGYIEFWHVLLDEGPRLEKTDVRVAVPRGPHNLVLIP